MRKVAIAAGVLVALLPAGGWLARNVLMSQVVIANESGRTVRAMTVELAGKTIRFGDLPPGAWAAWSFDTPYEESTFEWHGRLDDETEIHEHCGYVVSTDYGKRFNLMIQPDGEVEERLRPLRAR